MKKFIGILTIGSLLWSCTTNPINESDVDEIEVEDNIGETAAIVEDLTVKEFVDAPFGVSKKGADLWERKDTIHPKSKDTLSVERYKESVFHIYNNKYIDATILDKELVISNNIHIGMSKQEFKDAFTNYAPSKNNPFVSESQYSILMSCCSDHEMNDTWEFGFGNDTLEIIKFDHYIDTDIQFTREDILD